jgi:spore coat polysaccharide biosynthesis predicted glycosyltransferase SpsG
MSKIEDLVYSAHDLNKRKELFKNVSLIKSEKPNMLLEDVYELAYQKTIKENNTKER